MRYSSGSEDNRFLAKSLLRKRSWLNRKILISCRDFGLVPIKAEMQKSGDLNFLDLRCLAKVSGSLVA